MWAVISPFNFPLALAAGPAGGALVAGNTAVFKPASATPLLGYKLYEVMAEAGIPPGVFNFITGGGSTAGQELIDNADVDGIVFTGSKDVGMHLIRDNAARRVPRPLIIEMGGKNPALIMPSADLDKASDGVMRSAFGAQGQKCSACSRVYITKQIRDEFVRLLVEKTKKIKIGNPLDRDVYLGPVINEDAVKTFERAVAQARRDGGKILTGGRRLTDGEFRARPFRGADDHRRPADEPPALFRRAVRPDHGHRRRDVARRSHRPGEQHGIRADGRRVLGGRPRDSAVLRPHSGRRHLREPPRRRDHRRLAGHQLVRRLESQRVDRPRHRRPVLRPAVHARAEPGANPMMRRTSYNLVGSKGHAEPFKLSVVPPTRCLMSRVISGLVAILLWSSVASAQVPQAPQSPPGLPVAAGAAA